MEDGVLSSIVSRGVSSTNYVSKQRCEKNSQVRWCENNAISNFEALDIT